MSLTLLLGTFLFVLRVCAVLAIDNQDPGGWPGLARWHVGLTLWSAFPLALFLAAIAVGFTLELARHGVLCIGVCGAVFLLYLTGWLVDDPRFIPNPASEGGRTVLFVLAAVALLLSFALLLSGRRELRANASWTLFTGPVVLTASALFAATISATAWFLYRRVPPTRPVHEVAREILSGPPSWTVVSGQPDQPPRVGVLTPSLDWRVDGGDIPALIMTPPCEVRFGVRPEDGPVRLRASAGCDRRVRWQLSSAPEDTAVGFEIEVNGKPVFTARVPGHPPDDQRVWHHAGGWDGLPLAPGDVVTLRTSLTPPDAPVLGTFGLLAGFGPLVLERAVDRPRERATQERPNIVLILMDTLRADELSCYGHPGPTTPELDALGRRGVLYERAYPTASWTWPSTASILTGLSPEAHGVVDDGACYLDGSLDTLAEVLVRKNTTTGAFVCNPLIDPVKNFEQGFETFEFYKDFRKSDAILPEVQAWIRRYADARFFLYLHLVDTHDPLFPRREDLDRVGASEPPDLPERATLEYMNALLKGGGVTAEGTLDPDLVIPKAHQKWIRDSYSAAVSTADHYVGEVLHALEEYGLESKTLVAFTSDHGEELLDHGLIGHGQTLYEEVVHVPLILAGPGVPRGIRVATPVSNMSLAWTLARRGGSEMGGDSDRVDLTSPQQIQPRTIFFSSEHGWSWNARRSPLFGIQEWPWVLHYGPRWLPWGVPAGTDPGDGQMRLYDLVADPLQRTDRSAERPEFALALRHKAIEHARIATERHPLRSLGAGEATLRMLKRFGYAGDDR